MALVFDKKELEAVAFGEIVAVPRALTAEDKIRLKQINTKNGFDRKSAEVLAEFFPVEYRSAIAEFMVANMSDRDVATLVAYLQDGEAGVKLINDYYDRAITIAIEKSME